MASKEHQVAVPETGKPDGDVQYFDSELDSDDDVQQTGDGAPNPPSQEGPSVRRRIAFEEMLHYLDLQKEESGSRTSQGNGDRL
ncbi:hypothetical protein OROMI_031547 [Orobanche minor]